MGPVGGAVAVLAGTALGAAGKLAESGFEDEQSGNGHFERAILAEAALQTVLNMSDEEVAESGILDKMKSTFKDLKPHVKKVAPRILPAILEPALRLSLDALQKQESATESAFVPSGRREKLVLPPSTESDIDDIFTTQLLAPTIRETDDEAFWGVLGSVLKKGIKSAGIVGKALGVLGSLFGGQESDIAPELDEEYESLFDRAILAEAALQALQQAPPEVLQSEGLFDSIKKAVQKIAPTIIKLAPKVIKNIIPIAGPLLGAVLGGESDLPPSNIKKPVIVKTPPKIPPKRTLRDLLEARPVKGKAPNLSRVNVRDQDLI